MKRVFLILLLITVVLFSSISISAEPGDNNDPIVVLSYLELKLNDLKSIINQNTTTINETTSQQAIKIENLETTCEEQKAKIDELTTKMESMKNQSGGTFEVVELNNGQKLIAESGTEIIVRYGNAFVIDNGVDGISDITGAIDLKQDTQVPLNHLLIVPRSDGRGIYVENQVYIMIRGSYTIIQP